MTPEQKLRIILVVGIAGLIILNAAIECTEIYESYILVSYFILLSLLLHYIKPPQDEEAELLHRAASRKRARGSPSTGSDRHKVRRMSPAQDISDLMNTLRGGVEALTAAIRDALPTPALKTSVLSIAVSIVEKEADFSQYDMDDALDIFMNNPRVADTYAAIQNARARTRFLRKRLDAFQKEKLCGIRKD
jgi:hypothetical protein